MYNYGMNRDIKKICLLVMVAVVFFSCAPVIRKDLIDSGSKDVPFTGLRERPEVFKDRLFVLGGIIALASV
ncbi:MAG: hypothetical protein ACM3ON_03125 [Chloroflexota bacterium]